MKQKTVQYDIKLDDVLEYKRRKSARLATHRALCAGTLIKPKCCDMCGQKTSTAAHHIDYGKPLDVKWLCTKCHGIAHTEGHKWNPNENEQTGFDLIDLDQKDFIRVNFTIPVDQYLALMMECDKKKISVACRLRQILIESETLNETLRKLNDESQHEKHVGISGVEPNEAGVPKPQVKPVSQPRSKRGTDLSGMEGGLWPLLQGHGANARELQRA